ncbi:peptidase [Meridianimarinicoccus roseus]|uniref:Peptidase n=1 Tax=Meridianimarinicoccus roseus TaxID=2072018 RepID=A0A2V2LMS9_9RHOB|nr:peptidase [Meridianimarinicoccus roseus]PWR03043.1 peptidase [Meridianimarinicoccus roseus]
MTVGEQGVQIARRWIGTPYRHQASCAGAGSDCLGLLRGVWRELYGAEPEVIPPYSRDWAEPQGHEALWKAARRRLVPRPLSGEAVGDILLFRMREGCIAKHLGLQSNIGPGARFVHAYERHGVVESPLSDPWRRRIVARFAFPEEHN